MGVLEQVYFGNSLLQWSSALGVVFLSLLAFQIVKTVGIRRLRKLAEKTATDFDDFIMELIASTKFLLLLLLSIFAGSFMIEMPDSTRVYLRSIAIISFLVQTTLWGNRLIGYALKRFTQERLDAEDPASTTAAGFVSTLARIVFISSMTLVGLATVGFDINALVKQ